MNNNSNEAFITQVRLNRKLREEIKQLQERLEEITTENIDLKSNTENTKDNEYISSEDMQAVLLELGNANIIIEELTQENSKLKNRVDDNLSDKNEKLKDEIRNLKSENKKLNMEIVSVLKENKELSNIKVKGKDLDDDEFFGSVMAESLALRKMKMRFDNIQANYLNAIAEKEKLAAELNSIKTGNNTILNFTENTEMEMNMA